MAAQKVKVELFRLECDQKLSHIGNLVHDDVPVSSSEKDNKVISTWGTATAPNCKRTLHHHELLWMIGGYEPERGVAVAGHRAYFLTGKRTGHLFIGMPVSRDFGRF